MKKSNYILITALVALLIAVVFGVVGFTIGYGRGYQAEGRGLHSTDTVRIVTTDTCFLPSIPDTVVSVKYKVRKVQHYDTILRVDSVRVLLPFEQHFARLDDVADVWYSGYEARIDSAMVFKTNTTEIVNHYITESSPRNMVSITAGAVDASLGYLHRFGPVWVGASAGYTYSGEPTVRGTIGFQF